MTESQSRKIFITKPNVNVPWGFCIQGGIDLNCPLTVFKVYENSPAFGKIDPGSFIMEIAGVQTKSLTHDEALELIKKCNNALFLTIVCPQNSASISGVDNKDSDFEARNVEQFPEQPKQFHIPEPPPLNALHMKQKYMRPIKNVDAGQQDARELASERPPPPSSTYAEGNGKGTRIPERLLSTMTKPGMKPFTYTPRGIDLDEVMERARSRMQNRRQQKSVERSMPESSYANHSIPMPAHSGSCSMRSSYYDTEAVTHSKSFQRLQGWIDNSSQRSVSEHRPNPSSPNQSIQNPRTLEGADYIPSKMFAKLQQSCANQQQSQYIAPTSRVPARDRELESEAKKYSGSSIPSKSFKLLERFTVPENVKASSNIGSDVFDSGDMKSQTDDWKSTLPSRSFKMLQKLAYPESSQRPN